MTRSARCRVNNAARKLAKRLAGGRRHASYYRPLTEQDVRELAHDSGMAVNWPYAASLFNAYARKEGM